MDASPHGQAALQAAAQLATQMRAELQGLFVEDVNLLRLASLPFAQELSLVSAQRRRLERPEVERQLRVQARRLRQLFEAMLAQQRLHGRFRVARGRVQQQILQAAEQADLIILGRAFQVDTGPERLGRATRAVVSRVPGLILLMEKGAELRPPIVIVYDGSSSSRRALDAALALQEESDMDMPLTVIIWGDGEAEADTLKGEVNVWRQARSVTVRYKALTDAEPNGLALCIQREACGVLVLPARGQILRDETVLDLIEKVALPVLLVK
jgi:nucleotide-binding universal stress UspA family protein